MVRAVSIQRDIYVALVKPGANVVTDLGMVEPDWT